TVDSGAFSPDGRCVALDHNDGTVTVYELATAKARHVYGNPVAARDATRFALTPPQTRVLFTKHALLLRHAGLDHVVHVWDVVSGKELETFQGHRGAINCLALSPDGKTLASASADTTVLLWDLTRVVRPEAHK